MRTPNKSRSRNKSNRRNNNNVGNVLNRVYESAGPEGRVRGTPAQVIEKYQTLAHDSFLAGDRVATENFQQHAEHYIRLINEAQRQAAERREAQERQNGNAQPQDRQQPANQQGDVAAAPVADSAPGTGEQPDIAEANGVQAQPDDQGSGLVETPEGEAPVAAKPKRSRRPKPGPETDQPAAE